MKARRTNDQCGLGRLPASAPLANPYVPFQGEAPPKYEARRGLIRGTLFPGLDLPFQGKVNTRELPVTPLSELQTLNFAIQELQLYLDTHQDDRQALEEYHTYQQLYRQCLEKYQEHFGPLNQFSSGDCPAYQWLDDPWPWEYCVNKGV